jgi:hypothetical protein
VGIFLQMSDGEEDQTVLTGRFTKQELDKLNLFFRVYAVRLNAP